MHLLSKKNYSWLIVTIFIIAICGCAGSKSTIVHLKLTSLEKDSINLMPFNTTFERKYYSDVDKRGNISLLGMLIANEINKRSGLYTYTFDDNDLKNLRISIINSLTAANHYSAVSDVPVPDDNLSDHGIRLYIDFESMGVSQKLAFICEIKAHAKVCDSREKVLAEKDIHVSEKGVMTLMAAKNKAIEQFIIEIGILLNNV
jgi:hypothetical protein